MKNLNSKLFSFGVGLGFVALSVSCTKNAINEPEIVPEAAAYALVGWEYFMTENDYIDTLTVDLGDTTIYNYGPAKVTSKFADDYAHLTKGSYFQITNTNLLPADLNLAEFEVPVPSQLVGNGSFSYFPTRLQISPDSLEVPYGKFWSDSVSVIIPGRSKIIIDRSVQAHRIKCSFKAIIADNATGQNYDLRGNWKGLLRYDQLRTKLTERPLKD